MTCVKFTEGQLSDYTDGALSPMQQLRVHRHLRHCPHCASEVTVLQALNRDAQKLYTDCAPVSSSLVRSRRALVRPLLAAGVTAAVAGLWFAPEMPGRPRVAFADVENAMRQVKTAHWTTTSAEYDGRGKLIHRDVGDFWIQTDPATLVFRLRSQATDARGNLGKISEMITLRTANRQVQRDWFGDWFVSRGEDKNLPAMIRDSITAPSRLSSDPKSALWTQQREVVGERQENQIHFRHTINKPPVKLIVDVWADARTLRVARRVESYRRDTPGKDGKLQPDRRIRSVVDDFHYNEPIPRDLLTLAPPPGAKVTEKKAW